LNVVDLSIDAAAPPSQRRGDAVTQLPVGRLARTWDRNTDHPGDPTRQILDDRQGVEVLQQRTTRRAVDAPMMEATRLAAVRRYHILDTPPDGTFTAVCELAAQVCDVPIATVTVVDQDRIWFAAGCGLASVEIPREPGLCGSAVLHDGDLYLVTEATIDPRMLNNSLVRGEFGLRFYAAAPIITADGHRLGTVNVIDRRPRQLTDAQAQALRTLAPIVADKLELRLQAIEAVAQERAAVARAEAGQRRSAHLARTLQRSLSPPVLPAVAWLRLATAYHPASIDDVGGDFYDFFALPDGSYAMFVGDVCGKGARAAALTSLTRYTLRGAAIVEADPAAVLAQLNAALLLEQEASGDGAAPDPTDDELLCTVVYGRLYPPRKPGGSADLVLARAGHPPPLIVHPDHSVQAVACEGPMVGILEQPTFTAARLPLHPGDTLLLYTDGITDTRTLHGRLGQDGLTRFLTAGDTTPAAIISRLDTHLAGPDPTRRDDIAAIALTVVADPDEPNPAPRPATNP